MTTRWQMAANLTLALVAGLALPGGCPFVPPDPDVAQIRHGEDPLLPTLGDILRAIASQPPHASAEVTPAVVAGQRVLLDGSRSSHPEGDRLSYRWIQTGFGPRVTLEPSPFGSIAEFTAPTVTEPIELTFRLVVYTGFRAQSADVSVLVQPAAE
ncbi:MAG: hypothetical protein IPM18_10370 [Phycisphaerales bacterium]|nr:hypothetical protein [Phycisphaerales bacterium]